MLTVPLAHDFKSVNQGVLRLPQALKDREDAVRSGRLTTIIFIRDHNSRHQEVSGYIDFGHRLKTENMEPYFDRKKRLMPKATDLSFYNWSTHLSTSNATAFFQVRWLTRS